MRGSLCDGPIAKPRSAPVNQRTEACRASIVSKSSCSVCWRTTIAFRKPDFSKALFHSRIPSATAGRYFSGTFRSIQYVIGSFGSDTAAFGSRFSSRQRFT